MSGNKIIEILTQKGVKVTPQRIAVYEAVIALNNHPTTDQIILYTKKHNPHISISTVYKVLDFLVEHAIIKRVKSEKDIMRYDAVMSHHHHIYCSGQDLIVDYIDAELDELIQKYFEKKHIKDFIIEDVVLQIKGTYNKKTE